MAIAFSSFAAEPFAASLTTMVRDVTEISRAEMRALWICTRYTAKVDIKLFGQLLERSMRRKDHISLRVSIRH